MACKTKMSLIAFPSQANRYQNSRTRIKTIAQETTEDYKTQLIRLLWSMIIDKFYTHTYIYIHRHNLMISNYINIRGYYQTAANSSRCNNGITFAKNEISFPILKFSTCKVVVDVNFLLPHHKQSLHLTWKQFCPILSTLRFWGFGFCMLQMKRKKKYEKRKIF